MNKLLNGECDSNLGICKLCINLLYDEVAIRGHTAIFNYSCYCKRRLANPKISCSNFTDINGDTDSYLEYKDELNNIKEAYDDARDREKLYFD